MSDRSTDHTKPLNMYLGERCHFSIRFLSTYRDGDGEVAPVVATPCQGQSESSLHKGAPSSGALGVAGLVHWVWLVWCSHAKVVVSGVVCVQDKLLHSVGSCIK